MNELPLISPEALEFIRKRLPLELKNLIYAYIDIETRLDILLENKQTMINDLYIIPESTLNKLFNVCITDKMLVNLGSVGPYNSIVYDLSDPYILLSKLNYKSLGFTHCILHPAENDVIFTSSLRNIPFRSIRSMNNPNIVDHRRVSFIVSSILRVINLYSSLYTTTDVDHYAGRTLSPFDYAIRKRLFHFIHCIHKRIVYYKKLAAEKAHMILMNRCERVHRYVFKRRILKAAMRKSLVMCKKREKIEKKEAAVQAKLEKNEAAVQAKLAKKEAAVQAKLAKKEAAVQAKLAKKGAGKVHLLALAPQKGF
jgi:hypothetical protein